MKALVVDDCESLRSLFQLFLENMGFETDEASDGSVAFSMLQQTDYDIIISDMDMPFVNGMELYGLIEKYLPHLVSRIIFATGNSFDETYKSFFLSVTNPVLFKPFHHDDLTKIVQSLMSNSHGVEARKAVGA